VSERFEKIGGGPGYIWALRRVFGVCYPAREDRRRWPNNRRPPSSRLASDAKPEAIKTRVTLFVNGANCGSRLIPGEDLRQPLIQEWRIDGFFVRLRAMRGLPLAIRSP